MIFSFIHISDIHLGRPFSDLTGFAFDENLKDLYNKAAEKAFSNFIDFALLKNVDFVLISGDTFDGNEQDFRSKLILKEGLKKLEKADITTIIICGNHDPIPAYNKNTFNFDEFSNIKIVGVNTDNCCKITICDKNNVPAALVHALSYENNYFNENPVKYFSKAQGEEQSLFNIGLLHCDINGNKDSSYAPCLTSELQSLNYDYWALGHIHIPEEISSNIQYSGTIQGRNTKETGSHGIKYITVENGHIIRNNFVPVDLIRFENISIDISPAKEITDAFSIIYDSVSDFINKNSMQSPELFLLRLKLEGFITFYNEINNEFYETISEKIKNDFNKAVYISDILNGTKQKADEKTFSEDDGISGEIYRMLSDENIYCAMDTVEKDIKNLLDYCNFSDNELQSFKNDIKNTIKEDCINLCNNIYYNESKEE